MLEVPDSWHALRDALSNETGVAMLLGARHTGKSTLARWLASELASGGRRVAVIDSDLGQSNVGPPGTLGLAPVKKAFESFAELTPSALFFVGALSPVGVEAAVSNGLGRLLKLARRPNPHTVLVNTSGYTPTPFMLSCIEAVDPTLVVVVSQGDEMDELKAALPDTRKVIEFEAAAAASEKSDGERQANRDQAFGTYFLPGQVWSVQPVQVRVQSLKGADAPWLPNRLIGLLDGAGICLGVGVSLPLDRDRCFRIFTPLHTVSGINRMIVGSAEVSPEQLNAWMSRSGSVDRR